MQVGYRHGLSRGGVQTFRLSGVPLLVETFGARKLVKPPALKRGDTVAVVSPATPVSEEELQQQMAYLRKQGFKVVRYASTQNFDKHYLSDTDAKRAEAINKAFANPYVKAIFSVQGGGGTFRPGFLEKLDWNLIRKNPKIFTGFSDITFLQHALLKKAGLVSFHASFPNDVPASRENTRQFWAMLAPTNHALAPLPVTPTERYRCVQPGEVSGELVGGNLALLAGTIGTPYEVDLTGKILFLEEWKQDYETIDLMMSQLAQRGVFKKISGLILGEFIQVPRQAGEYGLKWDRFVKDVTRQARERGIPVGYNFPIGHGENNRPLPQGVRVHFNSKTGTLSFLESPLT